MVWMFFIFVLRVDNCTKRWFVVDEMMSVRVVFLVFGGLNRISDMGVLFLISWCSGELGVSRCFCLIILLSVCGCMCAVSGASWLLYFLSGFGVGGSNSVI